MRFCLSFCACSDSYHSPLPMLAGRWTTTACMSTFTRRVDTSRIRRLPASTHAAVSRLSVTSTRARSSSCTTEQSSVISSHNKCLPRPLGSSLHREPDSNPSTKRRRSTRTTTTTRRRSNKQELQRHRRVRGGARGTHQQQRGGATLKNHNDNNR